MQAVALTKETPQRLTANGRTLRVINHPDADFSLSGFFAAAGLPKSRTTAAYILVGFGRAPSTGSYDAVVPPFSEALIPVPESVGSVQLLWPASVAANTFKSYSQQQLAVLVDWLDCEAAGTQSLDLLPVINGSAVVVTPFEGFLDQWEQVWTPSKWTAVLDQAPVASHNPMLRPILAPSQILTFHLVVLANTLTPLPGVVPINGVQGGTVLKRVLISTSAAGLVVIGDSNLTVGAPGANEAIRVVSAGAGMLPPIDFGEGLDLSWFARGGTWQVYAGAAMTLDLTVVLG